ncbi:hypothetical protein [Streptomyces somaliensis]
MAFVLDVFSRTIVGWQVANHMRTELPLDALSPFQSDGWLGRQLRWRA